MGKSLYQIKLEQRRKKSRKDTIVTDMDYVLRDKDDKDKRNTHDMTPDGVKPGGYEAKHAKEIEALKAAVLAANAPKEVDTSSADAIKLLQEQIADLIAAQAPKEADAKVTTPAKDAKAKDK